MPDVRNGLYARAAAGRADGVERRRVRRILQLRPRAARSCGRGSGGEMSATISGSISCALPIATHDRVVLGHGSGGKLSAALLKEHFLPHLHSHALRMLGDGAVVSAGHTQVVLSTDTFVVHPLEFRGGDIGVLAVNGTVNDLAMMGAVPSYLTAGFIIEEGLPIEVLDRIV